MHKQLFIVSLAAFVFGLSAIGYAAGTAEDEEAIRALEKRQGGAWNQHDAKAYASLFTEDGDCVNVVGWW